MSKLEGEKHIRLNHKRSVIIKPSIVFSVSDSFTTRFLSLLSILPVFPLYYNGKTKFTPIHASDVANLVFSIISNGIHSENIEAIGPDEISFKELIEMLMKSINKKRILIPLPLILAKLSANFFQILPNPLITVDQLKLLKYNNIKSGKYKTNFDINCPSKIKFKDGILKYSYNWKEGGQYSVKNFKDQ